MTPPETLRRAAEMLERARATRDTAQLAEARELIVSVLAGLDTALDPVESMARGLARRKRRT
jgi:hypothetical protein